MLRFVTAKKEEKVFVGIVDEEEEKVLHLREAQRQKGEKVTIPITMLECIERGSECLEKVYDIVNWAKENAGIGVLSVSRGENISTDSKAEKKYSLCWKELS